MSWPCAELGLWLTKRLIEFQIPDPGQFESASSAWSSCRCPLSDPF